MRKSNPFMKERDFLDIDELCVDEAYRRKSMGSAKNSEMDLMPIFCIFLNQ